MRKEEHHATIMLEKTMFTPKEEPVYALVDYQLKSHYGWLNLERSRPLKGRLPHLLYTLYIPASS